MVVKRALDEQGQQGPQSGFRVAQQVSHTLQMNCAHLFPVAADGRQETPAHTGNERRQRQVMLRQPRHEWRREIVLTVQAVNAVTLPVHLLFTCRYQRLDQLLDGLTDFMRGITCRVIPDRRSQRFSRSGKQLANQRDAAHVHRG